MDAPQSELWHSMTAVPDEAIRALPVMQNCLGDSLVAVYLYGSSVAGGLRPLSDVDLMAIVDRPMTAEGRRRLAAGLMQVSGRYPPQPGDPRPLEVTVFQRADLQSPAFPERGEFLYGEWLREAFERGAAPEPEPNPDFTLVLAQARLTAKALIGPPLIDLLPIVPDNDIRRAIREALPGLVDYLDGDERNVLLTLARMWYTLATGAFVPKDVAADWAIPRLPAASGTLLDLARDGYLGTQIDDWQYRQPQARELADELKRRVMALLGEGKAVLGALG